MASSPKRYFDWLDSSWAELDIVNVQKYDLTNRHIILGGGGLFYDDFSPFLNHILKSSPTSLTLWGIGRNRHGADDDGLYPNPIATALIEKADLVGLRDCRIEFDWVPCPSIHHPMFDNSKSGKGKLAFQHRESRFTFEHPKDWQSVSSQGDLTALLQFIDDADCVASSSYHGCLWATLFGRKVISVNGFSQKFHTGLPDSVLLTTSDKLTDNSFDSVNRNESFLAECRERSFEFSERVRELVSVDAQVGLLQKWRL
jgi:hypothetical protein